MVLHHRKIGHDQRYWEFLHVWKETLILAGMTDVSIGC
jgi:hypothetical protein